MAVPKLVSHPLTCSHNSRTPPPTVTSITFGRSSRPPCTATCAVGAPRNQRRHRRRRTADGPGGRGNATVDQPSVDRRHRRHWPTVGHGGVRRGMARPEQPVRDTAARI